MVTASDLELGRIGSGPTVLFIHGSVVGPEVTWRKQTPLADDFELLLASRPGFGASPELERGDFDTEAPLFAELLGDGAHLVGHSYGAVIALLAAARRPGAVRSLTVSEPGALRLAAGDPEVDAVIANGDFLYDNRDSVEPIEFLRAFRWGVDSANPTPDQLPPELRRGARHLMRERRSWEAEIPLEALGEASFPKLVISGGHSPVFDAVCEVLAERIGARTATIRGRGHTVPSTGEPYNALLREFLTSAG